MKEEKEVRKTDTCAKFLTKEAHRSTTVFGHMLMLMMPMWSSWNKTKSKFSKQTHTYV